MLSCLITLIIKNKETVCRKEGDVVINMSEITPNDLNGIYKEIADIIGVEKTILLHDSFQGQQVTFPKKLYSKEYVVRKMRENDNDKNETMRGMAFNLGYTESHLRKILKESQKTNMI